MRTLRTIATTLFLSVIAASCADLPSAPSEQIAAPTEGPSEYGGFIGIACPQSTMVAGTAMQCYARLYSSTSNGSYVNAWWGSSNTAVAQVNGGAVYAVAPGTATIYASWSDGYYAYSGSRTITVVSGQPAVVSSVTVTSATVYPGGSAQLVARAYDQNGNQITGRTATWSIDNSAIASISGTGVVTGQSLGATTARATIDGVSGAGTVIVEEYQDPGNPMCGNYYC